MSTAITKQGGGFAIAPANMAELFQFAKMLAESELVPKDYREKPGNVMVAIQMGGELGLSPMQSIQNIAVINGRPSLWGDAMLAVCLPFLDSFEETDDGATATCVAKRGNRTVTQRFSTEDAKRAGLAEKAGPWKQYPARMRQMRARGFALRDICADVLRGINSAEESQDIPKEVRAEVVSSKPITEPADKHRDGTYVPEQKQERKSEPPPAPASAVPSFSRKFPDKKWAGKPLAGAGGEILSDYAAWVESLQKDPKATDDMRRVYQRALDDTAAALDAIVAGEAPKQAPADPIAEGLQAKIDARETDHKQDPETTMEQNDGWGLTP